MSDKQPKDDAQDVGTLHATSADDEVVEEQEKTPEQLAEEYLAGWQRALADYENLKRESQEQKLAFGKYATQALIEELLPTLDYFDAAMNQKPALDTLDDTVKKSLENWIIGIQHVQKLMMDLLESRGLTVIDATGTLDTTLHESVEEEESEEASGTILRVVARGYKLHDKLLRPAKVVVSK